VIADGAPLTPSAIVEVQMRLAESAFNVPARVRWVKGPDGPTEEYLFGLEFTDLGAGRADVLNAAIADFNQRRALDTL
jgi:hypothetical protein